MQISKLREEEFIMTLSGLMTITKWSKIDGKKNCYFY